MTSSEGFVFVLQDVSISLSVKAFFCQRGHCFVCVGLCGCECKQGWSQTWCRPLAKLMTIFFNIPKSQQAQGAWRYFLSSAWLVLFSDWWEEEQQCFQGLWFLLKGSHLAKWEREQSIYPLKESHPDDVSNRWLQDTPLSHRLTASFGHWGQKGKRMGVGEIIISINEALRTIRTAGSPDLVSKATSPRSFVL